jgi:hypothetical protein
LASKSPSAILASGNASGNHARNNRPQKQQAVRGEIRNLAFQETSGFYASQ